jgi:methionyl-tRNA formyltransferase
MADERWRIALITTVPQLAEIMLTTLRDLGHDPVAVISARRDQPRPDRPALGDDNAPKGLDILIPRNRQSMEPMLRAINPDLAICSGFPWRIPLVALNVPRLGSINWHPAMLPRHRGPIPMAWSIRDGDGFYGATWHRMDDHLDTGPILAQATVPMEDDDFDIEVVGPRMAGVALAMLPRVLERLAAGDPGDPQSTEGVTWASHFGEDYVEIDWSKPARAIQDQVRAWRFALAASPVIGPLTTLEGRRVKVTRTSLVEPSEPDSAIRMDAGDGPIWVVGWEPLEDATAAGSASEN